MAVDAPGVLSNDFDPEGHSLTVTVISPPASGSFTAGDDGSFDFRPPAGFTGQVSFTYKVNDGHSDSAPATVILTVKPGNQAPIAVDDAYTVIQGQTLSVSAPGLLANDNDPDGDSLTVLLNTSPANGVLSSDGQGGFAYTPAPGFFGVDEFAYHLNDGQIDSNPALVKITVNKVNLPPVAGDDAYSVPQDTTLNVPAPGLLTNDSDPEGHVLTVVVQSQPSDGTLVLGTDGGFSYVPDPGYFGADSFTYRVFDGELQSNLATVQISVDQAHVQPIAVDDGYDVVKNTQLTVPAPGVLANDSDPDGHQLQFVLMSQPSHGHLAPHPNGGFEYVPDPGFTGDDSFTYMVTDGDLSSDPATVRLTVEERPTTFFVTKTFSDGTKGEIEVTLRCNSGQQLEQSFTINPDLPVKFTVEGIDPIGTRCEVFESAFDGAYVPIFNNGSYDSAESCLYENVHEGGEYSCAVTNTAKNARFNVGKNWILPEEGAGGLDLEVLVRVSCESDILAVDGADLMPPVSEILLPVGNNATRELEIDTSSGATVCSAFELNLPMAVESEQEGCASVELEAGEEAQCQFTNTVFVEGIPALDKRALMLLTLLLGLVGLVAIGMSPTRAG